MIKISTSILLGFLLLFLSGCAKRYDYTIHKPKVRYKPSIKAFNRLNRQTLGKKYIWAEERAFKGFDCSGLAYYDYGSMGINLPRTANKQYHCGTPIAREDLQKGDLVFFAGNLRRPNHATHVGIYLENGKFQQASSAKKRVIVSSLNKPYYKRHYIGARRYHDFGICETNTAPNVPQLAATQTTSNSAAYPQMLVTNVTQPHLAQTNNRDYYISLGNFNTIPSDTISKLHLSGYQTRINQNNGTYELQVGPFGTQGKAYGALDLNPALFGQSATVKADL